MEDGSTRLIVADVPYLKEHISLYGDLTEWAARKLTPDGVLLAYAGVMFLEEVFVQMAGKGLKYRWTLALVHQGMHPKVWIRNVNNGWKAVVAYGREEKFPECLHDVLHGTGAEKDYFEWQQRVDEVEHFVRHLTKPGDLVVSPFLGSGTDALAVRNVGDRRFVGGDIDQGMVNLALERLKETPQAAAGPQAAGTDESLRTATMPTLPMTQARIASMPLDAAS